MVGAVRQADYSAPEQVIDGRATISTFRAELRRAL
jgi:hypothetical protein